MMHFQPWHDMLHQQALSTHELGACCFHLYLEIFAAGEGMQSNQLMLIQMYHYSEPCTLIVQ